MSKIKGRWKLRMLNVLKGMRRTKTTVAQGAYHCNDPERLPAKRVGESPKEGSRGSLPFADHLPDFTHGWWVTAPLLTRS